MKTLTRLLLVSALGPITGPLVLGLVSCLKAGRIGMATWYGAAIAEVWMVLAVVAGHFAGVVHG